MTFDLFSIERFPFLNFDLLRSRITWSIRLRWLAVFGFYLALILAADIFDLKIQVKNIAILLGILATLNFLYFIAFKIWGEVSFKVELFILSIHIVFDLLVLTFLIHLTGGIDNPIFLFYLFHVVISSFVFPRWLPFLFATLAIVLFISLIWSEYAGLLPHYCIFGTDLHNNVKVIWLTIIVFSFTAYMTTYIGTTFMNIYRKMKIQVDKRNRELEILGKEKAAFFRFTSHELKSPIIAVKSSIDSVIRKNKNIIDGKSLDIMQRASSRSAQMLDIINELLELSNSQNGYTEKNIENVNVVDLINFIMDQEKSGAVEKKIKFESLFPDKDVFIQGNRKDLSKAIANLISNAIRYSHPGGTINISVKDKEKSVDIAIRDDGIGIPSEDKEKIFNEFYRSQNARDMVSFGTGLGLSLVKNIVEKYGGEISLNSTLGKGTEFICVFPVYPKNKLEI